MAWPLADRQLIDADPSPSAFGPTIPLDDPCIKHAFKYTIFITDLCPGDHIRLEHKAIDVVHRFTTLLVFSWHLWSLAFIIYLLHMYLCVGVWVIRLGVNLYNK